jgi:hypothetical protein
MALTTKTNIERYLLVTIDSSFDAQITSWIAGIEEHMNKMTDRQLIADASDGTYYYDGSNRKVLVVDDFFSVTSVSLISKVYDLTSETDITDYVFTYPANATPIWRLESDYYTFTQGRQNIKVVGRRGYADSADIPEDLTFAATVLVSGIINAAHNSKGEIKSESIGRYSVSYETAAQKADFDTANAIIKSYRRVR